VTAAVPNPDTIKAWDGRSAALTSQAMLTGPLLEDRAGE